MAALEQSMAAQVVQSQPHRASYTLERGVWMARCRVCGFTVRDASHSRAANWFLTHVRAMRVELRAAQAELDDRSLREHDHHNEQEGPT